MKKSSVAAQTTPVSISPNAKVGNPLQASRASFNVTTITPLMAKEMIADTIGFTQRTSHKATIQSYAEAMKRGEWRLTYEPITLGAHGNVLNGLHRLKACVEANVNFNALIVGGANDSIFDHLDNGRIRTLADRLSSKNYSYCTSLASSIAFLYTIDKGQYALSTGKDGRVAVSGSNAKYRISPTQAFVFLENNPDYHSFVAEVMKTYSMGNRIIASSQFIGLWFICAKYNLPKSNQFFYKLSTGINLEEDSPIFYARKKLLDHKMKIDTLVGGQHTSLILKAFDMFCNNERVKNHFIIPKEIYKLKSQPKLF